MEPWELSTSLPLTLCLGVGGRGCLEGEGVGRGKEVQVRATHRVSRLVVPLRSGNSWMSVAPFRDLETEPTAPWMGSEHVHVSPSPQGSLTGTPPSGKCHPSQAPLNQPRSPALVRAGLCLAGSEQMEPRWSRQPRHSGCQPAKSRLGSRSRLSKVTAWVFLSKPWAAGSPRT